MLQRKANIAAIKYYFKREVKRIIIYVNKHPEILEKLKMDLKEQGIIGPSVVVNFHNGKPIEELVFNPSK